MENELLVSPEGGAMLVGRDEDGNQTAVFVAEGIALPPVGTPRFDDNGNQNGYFCSRGWMPMPVNDALLAVQPKLVPFKEFDPFHLYDL